MHLEINFYFDLGLNRSSTEYISSLNSFKQGMFAKQVVLLYVHFEKQNFDKHTHTHTHTCIYIYIYIYICVCVCVCVYIPM